MKATKRQIIDSKINTINTLLCTPMEYMTDGKINQWHYSLSSSMGYYALVQIVNESGGEETMFAASSQPELIGLLNAFIIGLQVSQKQQ